MGESELLNADAGSAPIDRAALQQAMRLQGEAWFGLVTERCPHLFASVPVFISPAQLQQMREVIAAAEEVLKLPGCMGAPTLLQGAPHHNPLIKPLAIRLGCKATKSLVIPLAGEEANEKGNLKPLGVFYGYDFHLNAQGAHLIEINTNAGGAFLNALLIDSQRAAALPGTAVAIDNLEQAFIAMFRNEWRSVAGDAPLQTVAIVDEQPESQYLYPEFLLAQQLFERAGIAAHIVDPAALQAGDGGLYCQGRRVDLVYNRLTDFDLQQHAHIRAAWEKHQVVLTPNPAHYQRYADKRKLALLADGDALRAAGVSQASVDALLRGVPQTRIVQAADAEQWWAERKQWFFKPVNGYGSKGAYRGDKVTKRVFEEIMQSDYVAQRLALPGERRVNVPDGEPQALKYDVRCYVYDGQIQLVAARLYQGQTTNFRTPGGGFAPVRVVGQKVAG